MDLFSTVYIIFYVIVGIAFYSLIFIVLRSFEDKSKAIKPILIISLTIWLWLTLQAFLANNSFYLTSMESMPPKLLFALLPPLIAMVLIVLYKRAFILRLPGKWMTFFHVLRLPVELVLYGLYMQNLIPEIMTFSGRNFDILVGMTAPIMAMLFYSNTSIRKIWMIVWNIFGLAMLLNILFYGIFSTPYPFQLFGFDQPNIAVLQYPIIWLPSFIVPCVLFFHIACLTQLLNKSHPGY